MSGTLSMYGSSSMLQAMFGQGQFPPENYYLALCAAIAPTPYVSGDELDEPDPTLSPSYQRLTIPNTSDYWALNAIPNVMMNAVAVQFVQAQEAWGTFGYWALCDALTDGNVLAVGDLEVQVTINAQDIAQVDENEITVELGPFFEIPDS